MDGSQLIVGDQLKSLIERIERLREEQAEIKEQEKEVFAEAKSMGFMTRPMRTLLKRRAMSAEDRAEQDAILAMYEEAVGL